MKPRNQPLEKVKLTAIIEGLKARDYRAIGRAISLVENGGPERELLLEQIYEAAHPALKVGITGSPGSGKSSLVYRLVPEMRERGFQVAVLAVDPTSPFSGGAILADRIRIQDALRDAGSYMRSMASRGSMGGLSHAVASSVHILEAAGFNLVFIETVGSGQLEVDIRRVADSVVLVLVPESGDMVQGMKSGIIEIADIFVINKADREGAERMRNELRAALELAETEPQWKPPIHLTIASSGNGVPDVASSILLHFQHLKESRELESRRRDQIRWEIETLLYESIEDQIRQDFHQLFEAASLDRMMNRKENPFGILRKAMKAGKSAILKSRTGVSVAPPQKEEL
ncbi:MAG: methylmalonyl Co-A mutase-associated GTPase MeaB [bacterium JZ-2024 1]